MSNEWILSSMISGGPTLAYLDYETPAQSLRHLPPSPNSPVLIQKNEIEFSGWRMSPHFLATGR
jgi:hypothetical protein